MNMLHHLPVEAYTAQSWFVQEQKKIFSKVWSFAGLAEDITEPGQYKTVQAGLNNLVIVMGRDHRLRAFHNICRHRGTQLIRAVGQEQTAFTCPYHDWTYDLEGQLIAIPEQQQEFTGVDKSCLGLIPALVDKWRGMLFVHPDVQAGSIMEYFGDIEAHLGPHDVDSLVEIPDSVVTETIRANWKIVVENYIDVYHLSHLHSGTLHMYDHQQAEFGFVGPHYAFWEPLSAHYLKHIEQNSPMPLILPKDQLGAWVPMLFPGLGLGESESSWSTFHVVPLAPDLTQVEIRTKVKNASKWDFSKQAMKSTGFWHRQVKGKYPANNANADDPMASGDFMAEDIYACEQQQKNLTSPYFQVGPAAKSGESPILAHQQVVKKYLEQD